MKSDSSESPIRETDFHSDLQKYFIDIYVDSLEFLFFLSLLLKLTFYTNSHSRYRYAWNKFDKFE